MSYQVADVEQIQMLWGSLLAAGATVKGSDAAVSVNDPCVIAVYAADDKSVGAVCVCNLEAAIYAGAALSLIPAGMAEETIKSRVLEGNLMDNVHEVMNIGVNMIMRGGQPRLSLREVIVPGKDLPDDAKAVADSPSTQASFDIDVHRYGMGRITVLVS